MSKNKNTDTLINILKNTKNSLSAGQLSEMLNVSKRTVRNYIADINQNSDYYIYSDKAGYRIENRDGINNSEENEFNFRTRNLLSKLLMSKEGVSVYDEALELHISESTIINNVIPEIKKIAGEFDLTITSRNYCYYLNGSEINKRKLIGKLVTSDNYGFFSSTKALEKLFPRSKMKDSIKELYSIIDNNNFYINDYSLSNLLTHISIIALRMETDDYLNQSVENLEVPLINDQRIIKLANEIADLLENTIGKKLSENDFNQIVTLISISVDYDSEDVYSVVDYDFVKSIRTMLNQLSNRYNMPLFDNDSVVQIALHMHLAMQRSAIKLSYPNPLKNQIKKDFATIYDMAVYFCHLFCHTYDITLSEEEITFVAFHLGSSIQNNQLNKNKINCCLIVEDYHQYAKNLIDRILEIFGNEINITNTLSYDKFLMINNYHQLVLTTTPLKNSLPNAIWISPLLTKNNIKEIRNQIDRILAEQNAASVNEFIRCMLNENLYFRNSFFDTKEDYIRFICSECVKQGLVNNSFVEDVLLRESLSNTAFTDYLAIPHTITQFSNKTFMAVVHNDKPIEWGNKNIRFIFLIGVRENDMKEFSEAFSHLVSIFDNTENVIRLLETNDFESFCEKLIHNNH